MKTEEQKWETLETEEGKRQVSSYAKNGFTHDYHYRVHDAL
jgi:hypothetical protein